MAEEDVVMAETIEGEGEPGAAEPGSEVKPVANVSTNEGEEPILVEFTNDGPLLPPVALPVPDPRIVSMPNPVIEKKISGHKLQRDIKIFSAPSNYDENPPAKVVDMCIIMDCTGSMSAWIKHCKDTLKDVIDDSMEEDEGSAVRVAFVGYRDFCDKSIYDVHDFTYLDQEMKKFISKRKAKGGGDAPEDVQGALHQALNLSWIENSIKLCFFVADAPCHGRQYHNCNDDYPSGNPNGLVLEDLVKEFSDREILLTCYKLTNETEKMYEVMEKAYESGKEKDGFEFIDIRGQVQGHKPLSHSTMTLSDGARAVPMSRRRAAPPVMRGFAMEEADHDPFMNAASIECAGSVADECAPLASSSFSMMRSAPARRSRANKKVNLKSPAIGSVYRAATSANCRKQKGKMRKRKGW